MIGNNNNHNTSITTDSLDGSVSGTARKQRAMSRVNIAATYSREPARLRALTIAQQREEGTGSGKVDDAAIVRSSDIKWHQTVHKLHYVCAGFSLAAFIVGMVSFLTDHWYETRLNNTRQYYGLFWQCGFQPGGCNTIDWLELSWTVNCIIGSDKIKWIYYVNRGFIFASIVACALCFILIVLSPHFYLSHMKAQSYAVMLCMICPVVCWSVAIGRWASWQNSELYCGGSYCSVQLTQTGSSDCEEAYGYSFILGILCLVMHVFGSIFAVARHVFGEWALEDVAGEDLAQTRRRVNVEYSVKRDRAQTLAVQQAEEEEMQRREKENEESARRSRGKSVITNYVQNPNNNTKNSRSVSQFTTANNNNNTNNNEPYHATTTANNNDAVRQFQMQLAANQQQQNQNDDTMNSYTFATTTTYQQRQPQPQPQAKYVARDWAFDPNSGLDWSESLYLFRDPATRHLYDPNTGRWFDPVSQEWYEGETSGNNQ